MFEEQPRFRTPLGADYYVDFSVCIGSGGYGEVFKGYSRRKCCFVAIKRLKSDAIEVYKKDDSDIQREIKAMNELGHRNILRLFDLIIEDSQMYLVTEFCDGGDLATFLKQALKKQLNPDRPPFSQAFVFDVFCQIVSGMNAVHSAGFLHRDLKPGNILICRDGTVKIADFGLARRVLSSNVYKMEQYTPKGTNIYAAPNLIFGEKFSVLCDVWSCGVMIYELLTGRHPFHQYHNFYTLGKRYEEFRNNDEIIPIPEQYHLVFQSTLPLMMTYSEDRRISFFQLNEILSDSKSAIAESLDPYYRPACLPRYAPNHMEVKITTYATGIPSLKPPTAELLPKKQLRELYQQTVQELLLYMSFVYSRSRLQIELSDRMNKMPMFLPKAQHFGLLGLQVAIFLRTLDQQIAYLSQPEWSLPSGRLLVKAALGS